LSPIRRPARHRGIEKLSQSSPAHAEEICRRVAGKAQEKVRTRSRTAKIVGVRQCRHCKRRVITHEAIGAWRILWETIVVPKRWRGKMVNVP